MPRIPRIILAELAEIANSAHEAVVAGEHQILADARRAGEALLKAKAQCGHGNWLGWLSENLHFSERRAQQYMRFANTKSTADSEEQWQRWQSVSGNALRTQPVKTTCGDGAALDDNDWIVTAELPILPLFDAKAHRLRRKAERLRQRANELRFLRALDRELSRGGVNVTEFAECWMVSKQAIRRELNVLAQLGHAVEMRTAKNGVNVYRYAGDQRRLFAEDEMFLS